MQANDLALLTQAARGAGEIAAKFHRDGAQSWDKPDGAGPVTEADLAVNDYLRRTLTEARPHYGWLSEESPDSAARLDAETVFVIDPIDGTRSFVEGGKTWAHSIAVAQHGTVTAGVVYLPLRDRIYTARSGGGAYLNGAPLQASAQGDLPGAKVLATRPTMEAKHWAQGDVPGFERHHRPSLAYRLCLVAEGRFDAMLTLRPSWEWDIAAGALICAEAGATVSDKSGAALRFNNPEPLLKGVIAAAPALHAHMQGRLAHG